MLTEFRNEPYTDFGKAEHRAAYEAALKKAAGEIGRRHDLLIGGERVATKATFTSTNPCRSSEVLATFSKGGLAEADRALAAATEAFRSWSRTDAMAVLSVREAIAEAGVDPHRSPVDLIVGGTTAGMFETEDLLAWLSRDPDAITPDSLFRIYSMTKPITGMATMLLVGEGKLKLDQPLADILPKFANMQVQVTPDGSITDLRPARGPITIRHLITHTSGLGYTIIQRGPIKAAYEDKGIIAGQISRTPVPGLFRGHPVPSLTAFADNLAEMPLVYEPGTKWSYSVGLDLMGRVIEVVSGKSFDTFLKERIFDPCGMSSTFFQVPQSEAGRLTTNHAAFNGILVPIDKGKDSIYLDKPAFPFGGAGLVSSPRDYDRFLRMLAQYGTIGGNRVMSEEAVRTGTSNLLPPGVAGPAMMAPASNFGAGGRVGVGAEDGVFGWAGAAGTVGSVDMKRGVRSGIFLQFMPPTALPAPK